MKTFIANGDLSAKQYHFVKLDTDGKSIVIAGANDRSCGIVMNAPASGERAEVALPGGGALLKISETVALGSHLTPTAAGLGEVVDLADEWAGARAYDAGVVNDVISVEVTGFPMSAV